MDKQYALALQIKEKIDEIKENTSTKNKIKKASIESLFNISIRKATESYRIASLPSFITQYLENDLISFNKILSIYSLKDTAHIKFICESIVEKKLSESEIIQLRKNIETKNIKIDKINRIKEEMKTKETFSKITVENFEKVLSKLNEHGFQFRSILDGLKRDIQILEQKPEFKNEFLSSIFKLSLIIKENWYWLSNFMYDNGFVKHEDEKSKYQLLSIEKNINQKGGNDEFGKM